MKPLHQPKRKQRRDYGGNKSVHGASATIAAQAKANLGTPVCIALKDGSIYYGVLQDIQANEVILQGFKSKKKLPRKKGNSKAHISSLGSLGGLANMMGMFGSGGLGGLLGGGGGLGNLLGGGAAGGLLGGAGKSAAGAAAGSSAGAGGLFGNIGSFMKLGMGVINFIMPLMKNFSI